MHATLPGMHAAGKHMYARCTLCYLFAMSEHGEERKAKFNTGEFTRMEAHAHLHTT